jgi:hypothetical protein
MVLILTLIALTTRAEVADSPLRLTIVPTDTSNDSASVGTVTPFYVVATNQSNAPMTVWQESCSWGFYALSLDLRLEDGTISTITKHSRGWDRNFPAPYVIRPGMPFVLVVRLKEEWTGYPKNQKVWMRARYTSEPDRFGSQNEVWVGEVLSLWIEVTIHAPE